MRQDAEACKQLNSKLEKHLAEALAAYRQGNVQECIHKLSTKYDKNQPPLLSEKMSSYSPENQTNNATSTSLRILHASPT